MSIGINGEENKPNELLNWREVTTPTEVGYFAWGMACGRGELPEWCEVFNITDITMGEWEMIYSAWDYMEESAIEYFKEN